MYYLQVLHSGLKFSKIVQYISFNFFESCQFSFNELPYFRGLSEKVKFDF